MKLLNFLFVIAVLFWVSKLHAQEVGLGVGATYSTYSESIGSEFRISLLGSNNKWGATIGYNIFPKDEIFVQSQGGSGKANARLTSTNMDVRYLFNLKGLYIGPAVGTNILMTRVKVSVDDGQGNIISVMERESSVSPFVGVALQARINDNILVQIDNRLAALLANGQDFIMINAAALYTF